MDLNSGSTRQEIAENVRRERRMLRISQTRLARRSGMNQSKVSRIERGVQPLDIDLLLVLAAGLGKTADVLLPRELHLLLVQAVASRMAARPPRPSRS
jgi:transcriptional regulator with XRE-family HTH domain